MKEFFKKLFGSEPTAPSIPEFSALPVELTTMTDSDVLRAYGTLCNEVQTHLGDSALRSWDERFNAAVVQLKTRAALPLEQALEGAFASPAWNLDTLATAPAAIQDIADTFGGLDDAQKLYVAGIDAPVRLVAAWWPWRDGENISLRFMLKSESLTEDDAVDALKGWFGL